MESRSGWSSLPEELTLNILARLPLIQFHRLCTVCKSWNELAADREFVRLRSLLCRSHSGFALFLASEEKSEMMYLDLNDPGKWRRISLSFLPRSGALKFRASSGGLLLLGEHVQEAVAGAAKGHQWRSDLLVVNPVSKTWHKLPRPAVICEPFYTALWVEESTGEFVVVVAESELKDAAATEVFESRTGRWRKAPTSSRAGRWKRVAAEMSTPWFYGSVPVYCKPVYCGGAFYHMTWDPEDMVAEFDVEKGEWRCAKGGAALPGGVPWGVMEADGQVQLVEMSYPKAGSGDAALSVWELQRHRLGWVRAAEVPPLPDSDLRVDRWRRFAVGDGFVCATFLLPGTIVTFASQAEPQRGMIFDVARRSWNPMPDLPGTPFGNTSSLFSFHAAVYPTRAPPSPASAVSH